jgi:hypothetical protein
MALTHEDLERLWPEGPAFAYRAAVERLGEFADDTTCPATLPSAQQCWDVRHAVRGLLRIEAERLDNDRRVHGLDPRSWLLTSRPVTMFARIFLEGARR